ncbi:MAG: 60S ribosomal protein L7 [Chaenotheca gracillima]|nr:MAG: 60S ribosomal protein L7 [Chaenotheca gracillima]
MSRMRKGVGLGAFDKRQLTSQQFASHGNTLRTEHLSSLTTQLSVFQSLLQQFAQTHAKDIRSNPTFRAEFARMCTAIGVDPLASSSGKKEGSFWAQMLGGSVNDFYFELAVMVVEVCRATRDVNGGLIGVGECKEKIVARRALGGGPEVSDDDILRAVKSLKPLGSGFDIVHIGKKQMIRSVPKELNNDQSTVLEAIQVLGYVTISMLQVNLHWDRARTKTVIDDLVADSLVWVDSQAEETEFWSPSAIDDAAHQP